MLVEVSRIGSDPTIYENKIALKLPISLFDIVPLLVGVISQQNGSDFMQHFWSIMLVEVSSVGLDPTNYENKIASNLPISFFDIVPLPVRVFSGQNGSVRMKFFWSMLVEVPSVGLDTRTQPSMKIKLPISLLDIVPLLPVGVCLVGKMGLF